MEQKSKEKVLTLHDYFEREIKPHLNPLGSNKPSAIATKITSILINSKRHGWNFHTDVVAVREAVFQKFTKYRDDELSMWYGDLKVLHEEDVLMVIDKVIQFYIDRQSLSDEEKKCYKDFQKITYRGQKNENQ